MVKFLGSPLFKLRYRKTIEEFEDNDLITLKYNAMTPIIALMFLYGVVMLGGQFASEGAGEVPLTSLPTLQAVLAFVIIVFFFFLMIVSMWVIIIIAYVDSELMNRLRTRNVEYLLASIDERDETISQLNTQLEELQDSFNALDDSNSFLKAENERLSKQLNS